MTTTATFGADRSGTPASSPVPSPAAVADSVPMVDAAVPLVEGPLVEAPLAEGPLAEGPPLADGPLADGPRVEGPLVEAPLVEAPLVEAPLVEGPIVEAPLVEAPLVEAPLVEGPIVVEGPLGDGPIVVEGPLVAEGSLVEGPLAAGPLSASRAGALAEVDADASGSLVLAAPLRVLDAAGARSDLCAPRPGAASGGMPASDGCARTDGAIRSSSASMIEALIERRGTRSPAAAHSRDRMRSPGVRSRGALNALITGCWTGAMSSWALWPRERPYARPGRITVHVGVPILPREVSGSPLEALIDRVRTEIASLARLPIASGPVH